MCDACISTKIIVCFVFIFLLIIDLECVKIVIFVEIHILLFTNHCATEFHFVTFALSRFFFCVTLDLLVFSSERSIFSIKFNEFC